MNKQREIQTGQEQFTVKYKVEYYTERALQINTCKNENTAQITFHCIIHITTLVILNWDEN